MRRKQRVQAMPDKPSSGSSQDTQINPGKAGPKGALGKRQPGTRNAPKE